MAKATVREKIVKTVEGVTLELSKQEADFLASLLYNTSGKAFWGDAETCKPAVGKGIFSELERHANVNAFKVPQVARVEW